MDKSHVHIEGPTLSVFLVTSVTFVISKSFMNGPRVPTEVCRRTKCLATHDTLELFEACVNNLLVRRERSGLSIVLVALIAFELSDAFVNRLLVRSEESRMSIRLLALITLESEAFVNRTSM